jgi:hypothetical protein
MIHGTIVYITAIMHLIYHDLPKHKNTFIIHSLCHFYTVPTIKEENNQGDAGIQCWHGIILPSSGSPTISSSWTAL